MNSGDPFNHTQIDEASDYLHSLDEALEAMDCLYKACTNSFYGHSKEAIDRAESILKKHGRLV
jgi:hypothetical protein